MIVTTVTNKKWWIWTRESNQTFVQGGSINRYIVLIPLAEFELPEGTVLRILKYLYGLSEAGNAWHHKLKKMII